MNDKYDTALILFKILIGITHDKRDFYFNQMLSGAADELNNRGIDIDTTNTEDNILLADYCEFNYRNRGENKPMPQNLELRIRNKKAKGRANYGT
jgi:hypothetical protein